MDTNFHLASASTTIPGYALPSEHEQDDAERQTGGGSSLSKGSFPYTKAKFRIGSCRGPQNFKRGDTIFHKDDVPADRLARKQEVMNWKKKASRLVGPGRSQWNSSMAWEQRRLRLRVISEGDPIPTFKYNYRAEVLPGKPPEPAPPKANQFRLSTLTKDQVRERSRRREEYMSGSIIHPRRTQELPVHPALEQARPWNGSTMVDAKEFEARCREVTHRAMEFSKRRAQTAGPGGRRVLLTHRRTKEEDAGQLAIKKGQEAYNHLAKTAVTRYRKRWHSGRYEYRESEGRCMWTDTGSFEKDSPGDCTRIVNPYALNLAGM